MGYKQPFNMIGKVKPEMKNQSKSGIYQIGSLKELEDSAKKAGEKLEQAAFGDSTPYGQTQQEQVISAPKQQIGEDAFKRTYREASEATIGKSLGSTSEVSDVQDGLCG